MRSFHSFVVLTACGVWLNFSPCQQSAEQRNESEGAAAQEILVKFKAEVPDDSLNALAASSGLEKISEIKGIGVRVYRVPAGKTAQDMIKALQADPRVEYAEPNYEYSIPEKQQQLE